MAIEKLSICEACLLNKVDFGRRVPRFRVDANGDFHLTGLAIKKPRKEFEKLRLLQQLTNAEYAAYNAWCDVGTSDWFKDDNPSLEEVRRQRGLSSSYYSAEKAFRAAKEVLAENLRGDLLTRLKVAEKTAEKACCAAGREWLDHYKARAREDEETEQKRGVADSYYSAADAIGEARYALMNNLRGTA